MPNAPPVHDVPQLAADFGDIGAAQPPSPSPLTVLRPRCSPASAGEIVVCASDPARDRLTALPATSELVLPMAQVPIGDRVVVDLHNEQGAVGGWPSNRMMVGVTFGF